MNKLATLLIAVIALTVIGCQPPEGAGGVTAAAVDSLKTEIQTLQTDLGNVQVALDSLTTLYNAHVEKYHKGGKVAPKPPTPEKPPKERVK